MEGFLLVNKQTGIDSGSIVNILKRELKIKKIGHTGTLDPLADGLLVLCIGRKFTRLSEEVLKLPKEYIVEMELGISTETFDRVSQPSSEVFYKEFDISMTTLIDKGKQLQHVPYYSALKKDGKRLRDYAESGEFIDRFNEIEIYDWEPIAHFPEKNFLSIKFKVSKGTYIRSIVEKIGRDSGCGAIIKKLTRTSVGNFFLNEAKEIEEIIQNYRNDEKINLFDESILIV